MMGVALQKDDKSYKMVILDYRHEDGDHGFECYTLRAISDDNCSKQRWDQYFQRIKAGKQSMMLVIVPQGLPPILIPTTDAATLNTEGIGHTIGGINVVRAYVFYRKALSTRSTAG